MIIMAVLTRSEILKLIKNKKLIVNPFKPFQVGAGSIDLHLGDVFRVFKKYHGLFRVDDNADYRDITEIIRVEKGDHLLVEPGELVHGVTVENISLSKGISARIEGRSRFARIGLLTHLSSGFMQPGTHGKVVLEIANLSPINLAIYPGTTICQIVIEETKGEGLYKGRFYKQDKP